jgi:hypothetical protein
MDPPSMIITTVRAFLRPLPSIIFSPNSLSNRWISHIEKAEEKTAQMGKMSNATSCALGGREEFNQTEYDDHVFGRNGKEKIDVNRPIRKEPAESEEYSIDCSGGSNNQNVLMSKKDYGENTSTNSAEEKVS